MTQPVLMCWSGGKDSCVALHDLQRADEWRVTGLLTTVTRDYDRISMHGVRAELLDRQAAALGLPVERVFIDAGTDNGGYEAAMTAALDRHRAAGTRHVAFGDLFLEDIRAYREAMLQPLGLEAVFPVWGRDTRAFAEAFIAAGFRAVLVCVDLSVLDASFAGRAYDAALLADLPPGVDPCGENGEFHSFVFDGPDFAAPVAIEIGETVIRDGFAFRDLIPA
ncbi:Dph6-related ATP pyrophosphatase [Sphingomonas immobilis]|uniref:Diphthamide synthase domain-containing protein n=1 Tax=Sphingomonas immobilis TaxID=3063997 RepID=A0ABT9A4Y8_9SPHN|nr:hypothetical protein [Sphingomonas sp. CA1-15]MDO7844487.1 hypothetical protein [Sphingomonas sp. CA1-15]